ncbi:MAG: hypothetical protein QM503_10160 [Bacteroidota bacterium]
MIKTRPNNSIIFHWILVIVLIIILIINIQINVFGFSIIIGLLLLTLIINRTTYICFEKNKLKIIKKNFLFIPTYTKTVELDSIVILELEEYINEISFSRATIELELFISFLGGFFFYLPRFKLSINSNQKIEEIEINTSRKEISVLELKLKHELKNRFQRK